MKKPDLKPCPYCGGVKLRIDDSGVLDDPGASENPEAYWVVCPSCYASGGPGKNKKEAVKNWNRRSSY
jgi:Lar family restriction alleviation protein